MARRLLALVDLALAAATLALGGLLLLPLAAGQRLMARRVKLKFYEAGMDMGWSSSPVESFRLFQGKVLEEYDRIVDEFGLRVVDASKSITKQQQIVRAIISAELEGLDDSRTGTGD